MPSGVWQPPCVLALSSHLGDPSVPELRPSSGQGSLVGRCWDSQWMKRRLVLQRTGTGRSDSSQVSAAHVSVPAVGR